MKKLFTLLVAITLFFSVNAQINDGAESYATFTLNPTGTWTWVDVDQSTTYAFQGITFENAYAAMSAIVFDPSATTPALTSVTPHGGSKFFAFFASVCPSTTNPDATGPNNDWMISPRLLTGGTFSFWAKSYTTEYGMERFKVLTSTTDNQTSSFTAITTGSYVTVDTAWTQFTYTIPASAKYVAIQCVSNDAFIFCVDDVQYTGSVAVEESNFVSTVYPNPASDFVTFASHENINKIEIYNVVGQMVYSSNETNNQVMVNVKDFSNGVYIAKLYTTKGTSNQKFNVVK
jgi:hypothetical protein